MSSAKKLQGEIDRVLKAVQEGQEVFEDIWEKVHEASTPAQKEKFEGELKTQIKKLQRLREQIKSWITNDAVKDKQPLMDARKRIESDMERFKVCEKETKTKAYSKDGLAAANTNDPETRAKMECRDWVEASIDGLNSQKDSFEAEIEVLRSKSSKKNQKTDREEECMEHIERHNYHVERLEMVMRLLDNDNLSTEDVNTLKDDVEYYTASNEDPDFQEDDTIYDVLRLDELNAGTLVDKASKKEKAEEKERREREEAEREANRLREDARKVELEKKRKVEEEKRVKDDQRRQQETERRRQEEERRRQLAEQQRLQREQQQRQQQQQDAALAVKKGPVPGQQGPVPGQVEQKQQGVLPGQQVGQVGAGPIPMQGPQPVKQVPLQAAQGQAQGQAGQKSFLSQLRNEGKDDAAMAMQMPQPASPYEQEHLSQDMSLSGGLSGLSQEGFGEGADALDHGGVEDVGDKLGLLEASMKFMPESIEGDRPKPLFDNPQVFDKLDMDTLFFIFYFQTGTLQQYLAARELKKQGWRFHKKYLTWFQRHEEPVETGHQCERGTYVYFDYETGWCQRIKTDFTFDYYFLEDEVPAQ